MQLTTARLEREVAALDRANLNHVYDVVVSNFALLDLVPFILRRYVFALSLPLVFVALQTLLQHGLHSLSVLCENCQSALAVTCDTTLLAFGDKLEGHIEAPFCEPVVVREALRAQLLSRRLESMHSKLKLRADCGVNSTYPCFGLNKSWATELVDQLAASVLDFV
jgi:hypothetical protein